ncbi:MAG: ATP-binding cassette domain-containing protein [Chitinophagaceae bacterium]
MRINCQDTGKRFNRDWIFRHVNFEFLEGQKYAITGPNGSGKSTLLQVIAAAVVSSEGKVAHWVHDNEITTDEVFSSISIAAPYLEVIEEMTLSEFLHFHQVFKPFIPGTNVADIIRRMGLKSAESKQLRNFSSGMKQRVKLAQAIFSDTPCLLLDEPCTNLDNEGIELYHQLIHEHCTHRLVIVSSNDLQEYNYCTNVISILDFKP